MDYYKKVVFENYANFKGRATRAEYWYFMLFHLIIVIVLSILESVIGLKIGSGDDSVGILSSIYSLLVLIPSIAVGIRRLHDIGKSAWMLLIGLIPIVGGIWLLVLAIRDGEIGTNKYGPNPKETQV